MLKNNFSPATLPGGFKSDSALLVCWHYSHWPGRIICPRQWAVSVSSLGLSLNVSPPVREINHTVVICNTCLSAFRENILISSRYKRSPRSLTIDGTTSMDLQVCRGFFKVPTAIVSACTALLGHWRLFCRHMCSQCQPGNIHVNVELGEY